MAIQEFEGKPIFVCWSCNAPLPEGSICPECQTKAIASKPKAPLFSVPMCGESLSKINMSDFDGSYEGPCCRCGVVSRCESYLEHVYGTCPHCGARGIDGKLPHEKGRSMPQSGKISLTPEEKKVSYISLENTPTKDGWSVPQEQPDDPYFSGKFKKNYEIQPSKFNKYLGIGNSK